MYVLAQKVVLVFKFKESIDHLLYEQGLRMAFLCFQHSVTESIGLVVCTPSSLNIGTWMLEIAHAISSKKDSKKAGLNVFFN